MIPHLNELYEKYKVKGLVVVGVTSESQGSAEKFVSSKGVKYPIAIDPPAMKAYGIRGIPDSVLIGPDGKVLWTGHPGNLQDATVEASLKGAVPPLPPSLAKYSAMIRAQKAGKAYVELKKAVKDGKAKEAEAGPTIAALEARMKGLLDGAKKAREASDFFTAGLCLNELKGNFAGTAEAKEAEGILKEVEKDSKARDQIKAGETLSKLEKALEAKAFAEAYKGYKGLVKKFPGTKIESQAKEKIAAIENDKLLNYRPGCSACKKEGKTCSQHRV